MSEPMESWQSRLIAAETQRAENARYWLDRLPTLFRDELVPTLAEFRDALAPHVHVTLIEQAPRLAATLRFDDWHLDEWTITARLVPSPLAHAVLELRAGPEVERLALPRDAAWDRTAVLDGLTDVYLARTGSPPDGADAE